MNLRRASLKLALRRGLELPEALSDPEMAYVLWRFELKLPTAAIEVLGLGWGGAEVGGGGRLGSVRNGQHRFDFDLGEQEILTEIAINLVIPHTFKNCNLCSINLRNARKDRLAALGDTPGGTRTCCPHTCTTAGVEEVRLAFTEGRNMRPIVVSCGRMRSGIRVNVLLLDVFTCGRAPDTRTKD